MHKRDILQDILKYVTYRKLVCDVCPAEADPNRTRITVGGGIIYYPVDYRMPTAYIMLVEMLVNSVISTIGAKFMTGDIKNFTSIHA